MTKADEFAVRLREAAVALEEARLKRDALIVEASERGISRRDVGRAVGLSPAGVQHILKRRQGDARVATRIRRARERR